MSGMTVLVVLGKAVLALVVLVFVAGVGLLV